MIQEFLKNVPMTGFIIAGQIMFLTVFCGSVVWVFRKDSKNFYQKMSDIPLGDDE